MGLKLNGALQLLVYVDDFHPMRDNTETIIYASKKIGLQTNAEKIKSMLLSCHQNARQQTL
jgi:hypothetical protein